MSRLVVSGLWKGYAGQSVLRGVDLEVPAGSLTAVLGLSGCGKTTLLRVIAGFERAEKGEIRLAETVARRRPHLRAPGASQRRLRAPGGRTVPAPDRGGQRRLRAVPPRAPRRHGRRAAGDGRHRAAVGRLPHELSGGEQQRVALARALARRPQALLLDEPFSSLDASLRTRVREEVHALLREQGVTTVLVTHDQEEALSLADSVAVLRDGRIVQQGAPAELYERPADERLARFLGAVNVLDARFLRGAAETVLGRARAARARRRRAGLGARDAAARAARGQGARAERAGRWRARPRRAVEQCRYYGHDALLHIRAEQPEGSPLLLARVRGELALPVGTRVRVLAHGPVTPLD